eukprot:4792256-Pyramimonas_sp.AAC.1
MPYSAQGLQTHVILFGRIGRAPNTNFLRRLIFQPDNVHSVVDEHQRRRGRPSHEWAKCIHKALVAHLGPQRNWLPFLQDPAGWRTILESIAHKSDDGGYQ